MAAFLVDGKAATEWSEEPAKRWNETRARFLSLVPADQRELVDDLLRQLHSGGVGLRNWLSAITSRGATLPEAIPAEIIEVYLTDSEAMPLHDCEDCGLAIPVRPNRWQSEGEPERIYFESCPLCGGKTGWYSHCSKAVELASRQVTEQLRKKNPR